MIDTDYGVVKWQEKKSLGIHRQVLKTPTGIHGFDDITGGGLPKGRRPSLISGGAGSGKTLIAMEFMVKGVTEFSENGVFLSFEESEEELYNNVVSLGFDLEALEKEKRVYIRTIDLQLHDFVELGDYNLEGLFSQIRYAIESVKAQRIVIDGIENLFACFKNEYIIRKEFKRLLKWLKDKGVTAVITCERGNNTESISRHGIEEYLSDCVILLDQRISEQLSTRRLRILKYRGSAHGTNEYPFLITADGISVIPITTTALEHKSTRQRVSTGIPKLDEMLGGQGYFNGSSILISGTAGTAGTGKSSVAASFTQSVCKAGGGCIYFAFEESASQIVRNMGSIGLDLKPYIKNGQLIIHAVRPTAQSLEMHLLDMSIFIDREMPDAVIIDPITNLDLIGKFMDIKLMFIRIVDNLKARNITAFYSALTSGGNPHETTDVGVSSIMDTWIILQHEMENDRRQRSLYVIKSREMSHSTQNHVFEITDNGIVIA